MQKKMHIFTNLIFFGRFLHKKWAFSGVLRGGKQQKCQNASGTLTLFVGGKHTYHIAPLCGLPGLYGSDDVCIRILAQRVWHNAISVLSVVGMIYVAFIFEINLEY